MSQVTYRGHIVSDAGIQTDPEKLEALQSLPVPKNVKEVGIFLGFTGYYRRFIENYVHIAKPLHDLLGRALVYGEILGQSCNVHCQQPISPIRDCTFLDSWLPFSRFAIALFSIRDCSFLNSIRDCPFLTNLLYIKIGAPHVKTNKMTRAQRRLRSAWASAQSSHSLRYALNR